MKPFVAFGCLLLTATLARADEAAAIKALKALGVGMVQDDRQPGKPVVSISFVGSQCKDADLKWLRDMPEIHTIYLGTTETSSAITPAGYKEFKSLKKLRSLYPSREMVTDQALAALSELGLLHVLSIAYAEDYKRAATEEDVIKIRLNETKITDAGLKSLAPLKNLQSLEFFKTAVTDAGAKELKVFKKLNYLYYSDVNDKTLTALREAGLLHILDQAKANEEKRPTSLDDVTSFNAMWPKVTDAGVKEIVAMKNLRTLTLTGTQLTDAGLKELAVLKNLTQLNVAATKVTKEGVAALKKELPNCTIRN